MSTGQLILSDKYKAFLRCNASVEFLEGTTYAGKTTVGLFKFMTKVASSKQKLHIIAAKDTGTAEKNIINKDLGIVDDFGVLVEYNGNGSSDDKIPHILFHTSGGDKTIYVLGYDDKVKWKKALGGQYGCLYIDEINTADIDFVREAGMRCDYMMGTLNPDDPSLPVYSEYVDHARPLPEWESETPKEIRDCLVKEPNPGWVHWFFSFTHNLGLSKEKFEQILRNTPRGTKIWKNKIEGLRGRSTGLVFSNFDEKTRVLSRQDIAKIPHSINPFVKFTAGLDTSYSSHSEDTIAMMFIGITKDKRCIVLRECVYNNRDRQEPLAPSDTAVKFIAFLESCRKDYGFARDVFIDSADQATITELKKLKRNHGSLYTFVNSYKKVSIIDRINFQLGWLAEGKYLVSEDCTEHIRELNSYSWEEDKDIPEDGHDHTINAAQYAWIPFRKLIGEINSGMDKEYDR